MNTQRTKSVNQSVKNPACYVCECCKVVSSEPGECPKCGMELKPKYLEEDWESCCG